MVQTFFFHLELWNLLLAYLRQRGSLSVEVHAAYLHQICVFLGLFLAFLPAVKPQDTFLA